jgi:hypothetical protein
LNGFESLSTKSHYESLRRSKHVYLLRDETEDIYVRKQKSPDVGVREIEINERRHGRLAAPWHFIVRHTGDIEDGRDVRSKINPWPKSIRILVLCSGDDWSETQREMTSRLVDALRLDYPSQELRCNGL